MTYLTCRLTAKNRDQLRNPTLGNRVWPTFTFFISSSVKTRCVHWLLGLRYLTPCLQFALTKPTAPPALRFTIPYNVQYMTDCCIHTSDTARRQHLRSAGCHQLFVPRHRRSMFGRRSLSVAGLAAWNSLPDYLRDPSRSFDCFTGT